MQKSLTFAIQWKSLSCSDMSAYWKSTWIDKFTKHVGWHMSNQHSQYGVHQSCTVSSCSQLCVWLHRVLLLKSISVWMPTPYCIAFANPILIFTTGVSWIFQNDTGVNKYGSNMHEVVLCSLYINFTKPCYHVYKRSLGLYALTSGNILNWKLNSI